MAQKGLFCEDDDDNDVLLLKTSGNRTANNLGTDGIILKWIFQMYGVVVG
jgi:hypothetical protein